MRTFLRGKATLLFMTCAIVLAVPAIALADTITADPVVNTVVVENNVSTAAGGTGTVKVWLDNDDNATDPVNGCNAATGTPVSITLSSNNSDIVFDSSGTKANPASLTNCGSANGKEIGYTVKSNATGPFPKTATITASGSGGRTSTSSGTTNQPRYTSDVFTVTITAPADSTAPTLNLPADITKEATGASGAVVTYTATADDANPAHPTVNCSPNSGSTFPIGTTTVNCSATDAANNTATGSFKVTVQDTTAPNITNVPADITQEAANANGATVNYTKPSATDAVDGPRTVNCSPGSGSTFTLGTTEVTCSASDTRGNTSTAKFNVTVQDTTAPTLGSHADVTEEATGQNGATVNYTKPSASDAVDPNPTVTCSPAPGATFPLGNTTVTCSAKDASGNVSAPSTFKVTVVDTTAPQLTLPADKTVEATGPGGAAVSFSASAADLVDGSITPNCDAASGDTFALGATTVTCTATDAAGNKATGSFKVTVVDTKAPTLNLPANITKLATGNSQAQVTYTATANDLVDGSVNVNCTPASGSNFSAGTTTVTCTATDNAGNKATGSFTVTVNYNFSGFRQPVDNNGVFNTAKAGSAIPIKFSLSGNQGLTQSSVIAAGYPKAVAVACPKAMTADAIEETVNTTSNSFNYDAAADQYNYVWKTQSTYAGKCYRFDLQLLDGTTQSAYFNFTR